MKTLCPIPWLSLSTESQREIRLCCHESREIKSGEKLENFQKTDDAFGIDLFKKTRMQMLDGKIPTSCKGCFLLEKETGTSPRMEYLERFKSDFPSLLKQTKTDGTLSNAKLVYLDVTTDNYCNLKCRMCRPRYSEKILSDWNAIGWNPGENEVLDIDLKKSIDVYSQSQVLRENFPNLKMITLTGGEPFLSEAVSSLLKLVIDSGYSKNIDLRFFTNTTIYPKQLEQYLALFNEVHIFCSVDGHGKTSDYIRFPSHWDNIERTYKQLIGLRKKYSNLKVDLHTVVQAYNVTQMIPLLEFLASFKGEVPLLPSFTRVDSSLPLSPSYLPIHHLEKAKSDFESYLHKHKALLDSTHQAFHQREKTNYLSLLEDCIKNNESNRFMEFVVYSKKLDKVRSQSFETYYPELQVVNP